ncbi:MAG: ankyrin repeat domain-containing protein [Terrimicrobiaceae bacterium]
MPILPKTQFKPGLSADSKNDQPKSPERVPGKPANQVSAKKQPAQPSIFDLINSKDLNEIKLLLAAQPKLIESTDSTGNTPLSYACKIDSAEYASFFLDNGALVNVRNKAGMGPLHFACFNKNKPLVKKLLDKSANREADDSEGRTPLNCVLLSVIEKPCKEESMIEIIQTLIDAGADVNSRAKNGWTAMHRAASEGWIKVTEFLLSKKARLDSRTEKGETPLFVACMMGKLAMLHFLLKKGSDYNIQNFWKMTPLRWAKSFGKQEIVKIIWEAEAGGKRNIL